MSYGRRNRKTTPPRLQLRRPRPYVEPRPRGERLAGRARVFWYSLYTVLIVGGLVLILLARR